MSATRCKSRPFYCAFTVLDAETSERFAVTVSKLKDKVTMLFIAHQMPRTLKVDPIGED